MNILSRRGIYKYMYSMYANYSQKVQETLSRPRFFYLNLIYPNISSHYAKIIKLYQETLIKKNRVILLSVLLLLFKNNNINKNPGPLAQGSNYFDNYKGGIFYSDKNTQKVKTVDQLVISVKSPNIKYSIKAFKNYFKELE